jgi:hypothetical protein
MPAVADLNRVWQGVSVALGVGGGVVPADNFDPEVGAQPGGECLSDAVFQHVHGRE